MKDGELHPPDREKQAIDEIGQELDREYSGARPDASSKPSGAGSAEQPKREGPGLRRVLALTAGTLAAAALLTVAAIGALQVLAPDLSVAPPGSSMPPSVELSRSAVVPSAEPRSDSGTA